MSAVMEAVSFKIAVVEVEFALDDDDGMLAWMDQLSDTMKNYKVEKETWEKPQCAGLLGALLLYSAMCRIRNGAVWHRDYNQRD